MSVTPTPPTTPGTPPLPQPSDNPVLPDENPSTVIPPEADSESEFSVEAASPANSKREAP